VTKGEIRAFEKMFGSFSFIGVEAIGGVLPHTSEDLDPVFEPDGPSDGWFAVETEEGGPPLNKASSCSGDITFVIGSDAFLADDPGNSNQNIIWDRRVNA